EYENRTLDVHIRTLRSKLGEAGAYIETVRGIGYRMIGEEHDG
ncbi:MAG: winged helix-turn-helix domain-containing protein, partial [Clostridia bacterium]|nr:winged helix-turn-helix domain-containing protein [Clostridia bacterium]